MSDVFGLAAYGAERHRFMATIVSLTDAQFEHHRTLCADWAPRDVLAHLIASRDLVAYLRGGLRINAVNAAQVARARTLSRGELTARGHAWAASTSAADRAVARFLMGDLCMHHQDVLRGLRRSRELGPDVAAAIFREGVLLSTGTRRNLLRYRVEPTTVGGRTLGRGRRVRGTTEAIGLWLAGRPGIADELEFG